MYGVRGLARGISEDTSVSFPVQGLGKFSLRDKGNFYPGRPGKHNRSRLLNMQGKFEAEQFKTKQSDRIKF